MPTYPIQLKRNGTSSATPSSLLHGEVALNYADGKLFWKDASNVIQSFTFQAYALSSHTHAASDITSGTLDAARLPLATTIAAGAIIVGTGLGVSSGTVSVGAIDAGEVLSPPAAPTALSATTGNASLALSWTAPSYGGSTSITGYTIEYTPSGGSASTTNTGSASTSYTLTGLTNGTTYSVRVRAINSIGNGSYSGTATGTPADAAAIEFHSYYKATADSPNPFPDQYSVSGQGSSGSPMTVTVGGGSPGTDDEDHRVWLLINQTGTLAWSLSLSGSGYVGEARIFTHAGSPSQHGWSRESTISGGTAVSNSVGGGTTLSGTRAVTAGQYLVVRWMEDEGTFGTNPTATATLSVS